MNLMVSEIINKAATLPHDQAVNYLRQYKSMALMHTLKIGLCQSVNLLLPPGDPPFNPSESPENTGMFYTEARKMYLFVQGQAPEMANLRRESLFIQLLESIHPEEAKILLLAKSKRLPLKAAVAMEAFPELNIIPVPQDYLTAAPEEVTEVGTASKSKRKPSKPKASAATKNAEPAKAPRSKKKVASKGEKTVNEQVS